MTDINPETGWETSAWSEGENIKPFPDVKNYTDGLKAIINSGANTGYYPDDDETEPVDDSPWNVIQQIQFTDPVKAIRRRIRNYLILILLYSLLQMVGTAWLVHVM